MKSLFFLTGFLVSLIFPFRLFSQCAAGLTAYTLTYDTLVIGNGNSSRTLTLRKFDPALGTLLSADLKSVVGLSYSFTIENQTSNDTIMKTQFLRTDDIYSDALDPLPINALNKSPFVFTPFLAHQIKNFGPSHMNYTLTSSITDSRLINFMGAGSNDFDYEIGSFESVQGPSHWQLNFTGITDTTHFSVTYRYCAAALLSQGLLYFAAAPQAQNKVLLSWQQTAVEAGRLYNAQVSTDGVTFTDFSSVAENGTGSYYDNYTNSQAAKKLFFRIKENNVSGEVKFSAVRMVEFNQQTTGTVQVIPTLYTGGSIKVIFPVKSNWQIRLYAADGRKVSETRQSNVYTASLQVPNTMGNGVYMVETFDTQSQQRQVTRIIVQR